jgi:FtsH-binding integral membrane protein
VRGGALGDASVSRSVLVTFGCCLVAAILAVVDQANDMTLWTALFATAVLVVTTGLVGYAALRTLGRSDDEDDGDEDPR